EAYYWNIPADLFPSLTNPDGVIRGGGWETIIKLLVQVTITVNNHKLFKDNHVIGKDYPSIAAVKAFLAQWNLDNTCQFNAQELFFWSMFLGSTPV
ncbi:hypothetical protein, partial [Salmonella enterica]|uniref:hypothetical protein n=1 Tax=Salmonella enterica TaxID=28901 RepID=UPI00135E8130